MSENKSEVREIAAGLIVHIEGFPFRLEAPASFSGANWGLLESPPAGHVPTATGDGYVYLKPVIEAPWSERDRVSTDKIDAASMLLSHVTSAARAERRERIATAALQGLLASGWESKNRPEYTAVYYADALIAELDKGPQR